ncbi:MAG TPA: HNH endonuclease signature motif containing protein [Armatimonadota bacterium]|nr:HNH endonuclease signature motif containing protein [Armatimonadota bacterium]
MYDGFEFDSGFWKRVAVAGPDDCWEWQGSRYPMGYGHLRYLGRGEYAHRVAYRLANGPIDPQMDILHSCDNPPCCNPHHLSQGSHAENVADRTARERGRYGRNAPRHRRALARRHSAAKAGAIEAAIRLKEEENASFISTIQPLIDRGDSWSDIGVALGREATSIRDRCLRLGIVKPGSRDRRTRHVGEPTLRAMADMLSSGQSAPSVAGHFGIGRPTMFRYLREVGIEPSELPNRCKGGRPRVHHEQG